MVRVSPRSYIETHGESLASYLIDNIDVGPGLDQEERIDNTKRTYCSMVKYPQ